MRRTWSMLLFGPAVALAIGCQFDPRERDPAGADGVDAAALTDDATVDDDASAEDAGTSMIADGPIAVAIDAPGAIDASVALDAGAPPCGGCGLLLTCCSSGACALVCL